MGLKALDLVVIDEIVELLGDGGAALLVSSGHLQLFCHALQKRPPLISS